MSSLKYQRILLKLSGEQLSGAFSSGIDPKVAGWLAGEITKVQQLGCQVVLIVGGGNIVRGAEVAQRGISRLVAEQMGMLSGLINALAVTDVFETHGLKTRCLSNVFVQQFVESFTHDAAEQYLQDGHLLVVAGGTGRPYFTHDTAAVDVALELNCQVVLKATKVDGVYDKDPVQFPDAKKYDTLPYQQAVEDIAIRVMDKAAMGLAMEQHMPIVVFDALQSDNILRAAKGETVGTQIS